MGVFSDFFGTNGTEYNENTGFRPGVLGLDNAVREKLTNTQTLPNTVTANRLASVSDSVGEERAKTIKIARLAQRQLSVQEAMIRQLEEQVAYSAAAAANQLKYRRLGTKHSQQLATHALDVSLTNAEHKGFQRELITGSESILAALGGW